ncbi:hypothetical protein BAU08_10735 [Bordetella bronchialis]|uniref:Transglutaminase n=1 Tax=Bordetella bronchialis TaxID=463025 RepID=A0A193G4V0_9BORD|nr:hypothetical protein BAU06_10535 [Bordetella bronchialis]ANN74723.1 hypothetical protein BAU08_10735 [Bordetella bronchialis]
MTPISAHARTAGVQVFGPAADHGEAARHMAAYLRELGLEELVGTDAWRDGDGPVAAFRLTDDAAARWTPGHDTTGLAESLAARFPGSERNLEREIVMAMLAAPVAFRYPSHDEFISAVRIKLNIVHAASLTELAFDTEHAERPEDYWTYDEARGFTLLPGKSLIEGLTKATQPEASGKLYSFSCYRATEYVTLLGIAQELAVCNPELLARLQHHWEQRAIMSGLFHDVFLREYGSMEDPLPPKYYVPGDRLWFRNPDEHSSNVEGFEGSWVFYLGGGMFNNFWKHRQPFSLTAKCVEIYHWRHGVHTDDQGILRLDETRVEARVRASMADPAEVDRILKQMVRLREPRGVYVDGGCIDTTRECVRWVRPGTSDLVLPTP